MDPSREQRPRMVRPGMGAIGLPSEAPRTSGIQALRETRGTSVPRPAFTGLAPGESVTPQSSPSGGPPAPTGMKVKEAELLLWSASVTSSEIVTVSMVFGRAVLPSVDV